MVGVADLDQLVLLALDDGPRSLVVLASDIRVDARLVQRRLHVMASSNKIRSAGENGGIVWALSKPLDPAFVKRVHAESSAKCDKVDEELRRLQEKRERVVDETEVKQVNRAPRGSMIDRVLGVMGRNEWLKASDIARRLNGVSEQQVRSALHYLRGSLLVQLRGRTNSARWSLMPMPEIQQGPMLKIYSGTPGSPDSKLLATLPAPRMKPRLRFDLELGAWIEQVSMPIQVTP